MKTKETAFFWFSNFFGFQLFLVKFSENRLNPLGSCEPDSEEESRGIANRELDVAVLIIFGEVVLDHELDAGGRDGGRAHLSLHLLGGVLEERHDVDGFC